MQLVYLQNSIYIDPEKIQDLVLPEKVELLNNGK